jgi:hypothetical protein
VPPLCRSAAVPGLVDELRLFVAPIVVRAGTEALPSDARMKLEPLDERRFGNGILFVPNRAGT